MRTLIFHSTLINAQFYSSKEKYTTTKILPEILKLDNKDNKGYQYLGVMKVVDFHTETVKNISKCERISRVQKYLTSVWMVPKPCLPAVPL